MIAHLQTSVYNAEDLASSQRLPRMEKLNANNYDVVVDDRGSLGWTMGSSTSVLVMMLANMVIATALFRRRHRKRPGYLEL